MKKILSVFVVLMIVSSVVFARRIDNPGSAPHVAVMKNGTTFKLYYKGSQQADVKVSIRDANNNELFSEVLKKVEGFVRPYNFSHLPEGQYSIHIIDKSGRQIEQVSFEKSKNEKLAHLLKVSGTDGKYLLTVSNKEGDDITVKIYDESNNVIYSQLEETASDFAKVYNLGNRAGDFTFEIIDEKGISTSLSN